MWHDNETTVDLLGYGRFSNVVADLALDERVLPVTIGLFGDWGSGKSSVLGMAEEKLTTQEKVLTLRFDGWLFEGYDDAKAALMTTIIDKLQSHISDNKTISEKVGPRIKSLLKRIDWFRTAGLAAKGILTLTSPVGAAHLATEGVVKGITTLAQTVKDPDQLQQSLKDMLLKEAPGTRELHENISAFRGDFRKLLEEAELRALVVLIDDLDRCLPESVVSTLEAIKLFLSVPGTSFVVAADERVVRQAVGLRYPHHEGAEFDLPQEYLDKLIQIPLVLPRLDDSETETYTYLLFAERALSAEDFEKVLRLVGDKRAKEAGRPPLNFGIIKELLGEAAKELETDFSIAAAIAPVLVHNGHGNPRLVKRFLNALALRKQIGASQGMELKDALLAKLLVLERFYDDQFQELHAWQAEQGGMPEQVQKLETAAVDEDTNAAEEFPIWLTDAALKQWLMTEPKLSGENLSSYFTLARESVSLTSVGARRLSSEQQRLFSLLQSRSRAQRRQGVEAAKSMDVEELGSVYDALWAKVKTNPGGDAIDGILDLALTSEPMARRVLKSLKSLPAASIPVRIIPRFAQLGQTHMSLSNDVNAQLRDWSGCATRRVSTAATRVLNSG